MTHRKELISAAMLIAVFLLARAGDAATTSHDADEYAVFAGKDATIGGDSQIREQAEAGLAVLIYPCAIITDGMGHADNVPANDDVDMGDNTNANNARAPSLSNSQTNDPVFPPLLSPIPTVDGRFGMSVAAIGNDIFLIGAPGDDAAGPDDRATHLLDGQDGYRLFTFLSPSPAPSDHFSFSFSAAAIGNNILTGASGNDEFAPDAWSAYSSEGIPEPATGGLLVLGVVGLLLRRRRRGKRA